MKTYKMNIVNKYGNHSPECTNCGHRFETNEYTNPYYAMCDIALGKFKYCPECGALYVGCQVEGKDFNKLDYNVQEWISNHNFAMRCAYEDCVKKSKQILRESKINNM